MAHETFNIGEIVGYTSQAGRTGEYEIKELFTEEIFYGRLRGHRIRKARLVRPGRGDAGFAVPIRKLQKIRNAMA